jgi:hypothetical protein
MGGSLGNVEDFSLVEEFVEDVTYLAQRYMGRSQVERRKQAFEHRLKKLRLRERRECKRQVGHVGARPAQPTKFTQSIARMQAPIRPHEAMSHHIWDYMNLLWRQKAFAGNAGMKALLAEEETNNNSPDNGAGLFVQEFQNSPDTLDPLIHRVFRPANFQNPLLKVDLSEARRGQAWVSMRPAMTLATKFLTDPSFGAFWYHLMYGVPTSDPVTRKSFLMHSPQEDDLETARADFAALLDDLADRMTYYWRPAKHQDGIIAGIQGHSYWEVMSEFVDISGFEKMRQPAGGYNGYIGLNSDFLYNLLSRDAVTRTHVEGDIRLQFLLAVTLTHELTHAIYAWRDLPFVDWPGYTEIFCFDTDVSNEIGWSWENHTFGDVILSCELSHDVIGACRARTWESEVLRETYIYAPVPDAWLKGLFLKNTWKDINQAFKQVPKPVGRPKVFCAQRYVDDQRMFEWVDYVDGFAASPGHDVLNEREGQVKSDVDAWFKAVRKSDLQKAVRTGRFVTEKLLGPRGEVLGKQLLQAPLQAPLESESESEDEDEDEDEDGVSVSVQSSDYSFVDGGDPPDAYSADYPMIGGWDY